MARYPYEPDYAVPPGQTLQEIIEGMEISPKRIAILSGISTEQLNGIIDGTVPITDDIAQWLEQATGVQAQHWLKLEENYRERTRRLHDEQTQTEAEA